MLFVKLDAEAHLTNGYVRANHALILALVVESPPARAALVSF